LFVFSLYCIYFFKHIIILCTNFVPLFSVIFCEKQKRNLKDQFPVHSVLHLDHTFSGWFTAIFWAVTSRSCIACHWQLIFSFCVWESNLGYPWDISTSLQLIFMMKSCIFTKFGMINWSMEVFFCLHENKKKNWFCRTSPKWSTDIAKRSYLLTSRLNQSIACTSAVNSNACSYKNPSTQSERSRRTPGPQDVVTVGNFRLIKAT